MAEYGGCTRGTFWINKDTMRSLYSDKMLKQHFNVDWPRYEKVHNERKLNVLSQIILIDTDCNIFMFVLEKGCE